MLRPGGFLHSPLVRLPFIWRWKLETDSAFYRRTDVWPPVQRSYWKIEGPLGEHYGIGTLEQVRPVEATLVASLLRDGRHAPALDIDLPCRLESSSPRHYHLYIDKPMSWRAYKKILRAFRHAGIIEDGYYRASVQRKATHLRVLDDEQLGIAVEEMNEDDEQRQPR
jgi:hypothetical protein